MAVAARRRRSGRSPAHHRADRARDRPRRRVPGLHQGHPVHPRLPRSTRCSSPPTGCASTRRCGSPASTSARSRRSSRKEGTDQALVTMEINEDGLPIHEDATAKIRPRIFLEGNFFVDLTPGSPASPELGDGDTIKVTRTADAGPARPGADGAPERHAPGPARPARRARHGAELEADGRRGHGRRPVDARRDRGAGLERRLQVRADRAPRRGAGQRGAARHRAVARRRAPARGHGQDDRRADPQRGPAQGPDHELQHHDGAPSRARRTNLQHARSRLLPGTLENANATLASLNRAFPPTRAFAREILPGVNETRRHDRRVVPVGRADAASCSRQAELRGLAEDLAPATQRLAQARPTRRSKLLPAGRPTPPAALRDVVLPTGDIVVQDLFATGEPNYKEFWQAMVGLAGESQNFDGNGSYVRFQAGGGTNTVALGAQGSTTGKLVGSRAAAGRSACGRRYPRQAAAVQRERALLQEQDPERQRAGGAPAGRARGRREDRDPQALARLRGDHRPDRDRGARVAVYILGQPAPHAARVGAARRQGLLRRQGRACRPPRRSRRARARP